MWVPLARSDSSEDLFAAHADAVWRLRQAAEQLRFRLVVVRLLYAADEGRFVDAAHADVEAASTSVAKAAGALRDTAAKIAKQWDVAVDDVTLPRLAERAPEPYDRVFSDHQRALGLLAAEIERASGENRRSADQALDRTEALIDALTGAPDRHPHVSAYDASGHRQTTSSPRRIDEQL